MQHWLMKSPQEQQTLTRRALWGVVWWGIPFFLLWAFAFPLYAGKSIDLTGVGLDLVLSLAAGALFGLAMCTFAGRLPGQRTDR